MADKPQKKRAAKQRAEVKAKVLAEIFAGNTALSVASKYGIPYGTVRQWASRWRKENGPIGDPNVTADDVRSSMELEKLTLQQLVPVFCRQVLITQIEHARLVRSPEYVTAQPLSEIAAYLNVAVDQVSRIIDASTRAQQNQQQREANEEQEGTDEG